MNFVYQQFSVVQAVRDLHGRDESVFDYPTPQAVLFVQPTLDVSDVLSITSFFHWPVIAYAAGSNLEGHLLALHGVFSLD